MPTTRSTAAEAYATAHADALALLRRIEGELASPRHLTPSGPDWGHVGNALELRRALTAISDRLFGEGEHAPERP